jgi:hypothetical protein
MCGRQIVQEHRRKNYRGALMQTIPVRNNLAAVHEGKNSALAKLIASRTNASKGTAELAAAWDAKWWGLSNAQAYQRLDEAGKSAVLHECNRALINEAYFIEKSGLAYTAKMVLLAENTDIAQLYALIGADEAKHLAWIEPYAVAEDKTRPQGFFLEFLTQLIEQLQPNLLILLVQIVLEGWGLDHYRRLSQGCRVEALAKVFSDILKDEALHHRSGNLLFDAGRLCENDRVTVKTALATYTEMVRVGPVAALAALDVIAGGMSLSEVEDALRALRHSEESKRKLQLLKQLMSQPQMETVVEELEGNRAFEPISVQQAAQNYIHQRQ